MLPVVTTWTVPARVTRVIDGDTVVADLDLGWGLWRIGEHVRVIGVNCPEIHGTTAEAGRAASVFTAEYLGALPCEMMLVSHKLDKYGRTLGDLHFPGGQLTLGGALLASGHAVAMKE